MDKGKGKRPMEEESPEGDKLVRTEIPNLKGVQKIGCLLKADPRDCSGCVTNFSTGNPLGGQKIVPEPPVPSAHGGVNVPKTLVKFVIKDSSNGNDEVAAPVKQWSEKCGICSKNFFSLKSLFNHYNRRHPEKEAGGSGYGNRNGGYKPKKLRPVWPGNWTRTAKRSETNYSLIRAVEEIRQAEEIKQAAKTLMDIYNLEIENRKLKYASWSDQGFIDLHLKSPKFGRGGGGSKDRSFKGKASSSRLPEKCISPMKKIRPQKMKTTGGNSSYSPEAQFKCPICYKAFTSYQALGGHRSSHNKPKNLVLDINNNVGRGKALGGGQQTSHWGDANQYDQEIEGSYLELSQLKRMKNAHEFGVESGEAEHYYYDQQEDVEMEDQHEEEAKVEDQEEDGAGASDWNDVYSDGITTSTPFASSSSS